MKFFGFGVCFWFKNHDKTTWWGWNEFALVPASIQWQNLQKSSYFYVMEILHEKQENKGKFFIELDGKEVAAMTYTWAGDQRIIIDHT